MEKRTKKQEYIKKIRKTELEPCAVKVACTVPLGGKDAKSLPIQIRSANAALAKQFKNNFGKHFKM